MQSAIRSRNLPSADRISVLTAMIMLSYALTRFIELPERQLALQLPGLYLPITLNIETIVAVLVAGLTAAGSDWLLRDHPAMSGRHSYHHWLLPALTALVIGIPLNQLPAGLGWWLGLAAGSVVLALVLIAEYIAVDAEDLRQPLAAAALTAVSFAVYLVLAVALSASGARLYAVFLAVAAAGWLVSLRTLHLRLHGEWLLYEAAIIALLVSQGASALHYWPLSPVSFGLALLGPTYALTTLIGSLVEERPLRQAIWEPLLAWLVSWVAAAWLG
ncbi:MAG TPA: hypothetical protein PKM21_06390 [Anaerolineales bacterium]|nr:hypothetical protein [Anaerolineales bacterium]